MIVMLAAGPIVGLAYLAHAGSKEAPTKLRVGVYDNRAIAVAYAASKYNPVGSKMKEYKKAEAAGDTERVKELKAWGEKHQRQLHRQGFGRAPVNDLLEHVKDKLPKVAETCHLVAIARQFDYANTDVEVVDITKELVMLFDPSEKTLKTVEELKKHAPIDIDTIDKHADH